MNDTNEKQYNEKFFDLKSDLEDLLERFKESCAECDRDLIEEIDEAEFNAGIKRE